jgi:hypothetical protein
MFLLTATILWSAGILSFALSWNEPMVAVTNPYRNAASPATSVAFLDQRPLARGLAPRSMRA